MQILSWHVVLVGVLAGFLLAALDAVLFGTPLAQHFQVAYRPISRRRVKIRLGLCVDVVSALVLAVIFVAVAGVLPKGRVLSGLTFGGFLWFVRSVMSVGRNAVMFSVDWRTHLYSLVGGLVQFVALGLFYGFALSPR